MSSDPNQLAEAAPEVIGKATAVASTGKFVNLMRARPMKQSVRDGPGMDSQFCAHACPTPLSPVTATDTNQINRIRAQGPKKPYLRLVTLDLALRRLQNPIAQR